jgi:hypothetical protein
LYVNGNEVTTLTAFGSGIYPPQNTDYEINATVEHLIAARRETGSLTSTYFSGYLADVHFIDGQALTPSSFTTTDLTTGQLLPVAYTGSYGTNGFRLAFDSYATTAALGTDTSGNGNTWTVNNLSATTGGPTSVASASGALPIFNTTDTYGNTLGSGVRTDALASSLVLDLAMGTSAGLSLTDQSPTGRTSGIKTITNEGITNSTSVTKFYGGAAFFNNGAGDDVGITTPNSADFNFGTGDFTIEFWIYSTVNSRRQWYLRTSGQDDSATTGFMLELGILNSFVIASTPYSHSAFSTNKWTHFAVTRSGTSLRIFMDGVLDRSYSSSLSVSSSNALWVGKNLSGYSFGCNMYLQDLRIYKGVAKYTGNFNPPSSTANVTVAAGNDSLVDVPVNGAQTDTGVGGEVRGNYCTWNSTWSNPTLTNGNLDYTTTTGSTSAIGTIGVSSGKWYFEITPSTSLSVIGVAPPSTFNTEIGSTATSYGYLSNGNKFNNGSSTAYGSTYTSNDVIGVALDLDNGKIWFSKNGTWQASGNPAAGTNAAFTGISGTFAPTVSRYTSTEQSGSLNCGQRPFAYTAPSGFKALCTTNLPAPLVTKPNTVFDVVLRTSNRTISKSVTGLNFSPDLVWEKSRSATTSHFLADVVRGSTKTLSSETTGSESSYPNFYTSFNSDGYTIGTDDFTTGESIVGWAWDAGTTTVSNTQGSITSQVRASASSGFSVVTAGAGGYFGGSVGHGLGVAPEFIILKDRNGTSGWRIYHKSLGNNLWLDFTTNGATNYGSNLWAVSSTVFGSNQSSSNTAVAYCFAPVSGYASAFSFTGNGSTDGPMCYLGFRPRLILLKRTDSTGDWLMVDTSRSPYNLATTYLYANASFSEMTYNLFDVLSNGFKLRDNFASWNASGGTYVGFAWAESPFQYARAR